MKADYEPWWMFEDWEELIRTRKTFEDMQEATAYLNGLLEELRSKHQHEKTKKNCFYAFWSEDEKSFCEGCDEDLQLYHGVILMQAGVPTPYDSKGIE